VDRILISGLRQMGVHGALAEEQERAQPFGVELELLVDLRAAGASDVLADTVDYGAVCDTVEQVCAGGRPQLLEHLAELIATAVLDLDPRITRASVAVRKLRPPVPQQLATSGVRLVRGRPDGTS
jgi:dihydroneopterin aldolase